MRRSRRHQRFPTDEPKERETKLAAVIGKRRHKEARPKRQRVFRPHGGLRTERGD